MIAIEILLFVFALGVVFGMALAFMIGRLVFKPLPLAEDESL